MTQIIICGVLAPYHESYGCEESESENRHWNCADYSGKDYLALLDRSFTNDINWYQQQNALNQDKNRNKPGIKEGKYK